MTRDESETREEERVMENVGGGGDAAAGAAAEGILNLNERLLKPPEDVAFAQSQGRNNLIVC